MNTRKIGKLIPLLTSLLLLLIFCIDVIRYAFLGDGNTFLTMLIVNVLFALCALGAYRGNCPPLYLLVTIFGFILFSITNNIGTTLFNLPFLIDAIISLIGAVVGTIFMILTKALPKKTVSIYIASMLLIVAVFSSVWGIGSAVANGKTTAEQEIWQVPDVFEGECVHAGKVEKHSYETKAYATDQRTVKKDLYVYLPYGYDPEVQYDILYLLHGSGDDEAYWLVQNEWNKRMLDNLIDQKVIRPVIVVTPTFYVENDCMEDLKTLDKLSYSFKDELRNDIIPFVESRYSTYADSVGEEDLIASREHRAFAGLSRGAVTTLHSVLCGSRDYFSSFGTFSASRTPLEYYLANSDQSYPISYWYVSSGTFDFGLSSQLQDHKAIVNADDGLKMGVNTSVAVYPMRYHSQENWHLALYNFLQIIYG